LIDYARPRPPAALALAYRLYQDVTRTSELIALNDAPHPLFMPTVGKALAARTIYSFRQARGLGSTISGQRLSCVLGQQHLEISLDRVRQSELHQWKARGRCDSGRG
jgi:hypothetical protein